MLKDWNHDLIQQLSEISDGLWRMEEYRKNSTGCEHCSLLWDETAKKLEEISAMLVKEINRHSKENRFD